MIDLTPPPFAFIVVTDQYAGNFERQLCAYMTGCVGDCLVGQECAETHARDGLSPSQNVQNVPDEHGCARPASIWSEDETRGSVAIWLNEEPDFAEMEQWVARARVFGSNPVACGTDRWTPKFRIVSARLVAMQLDVETVAAVPV